MPRTVNLSPEDITPQFLQQIAQELDLDTPIHSYELQGGILHLYLANDGRAVYPPLDEAGGADDVVVIPAGDLSRFKKTELLDIAAEIDLPGRSSMLKDELVATLARLREALEA